MQGLSLVATSGGHSSSWCAGLSLSRPLLLWSTGSRHAGSVIVAHRLSCSAAYGIFPDQGSNPCPLHWQADSQPLCHQGSPCIIIFNSCWALGQSVPQFSWPACSWWPFHSTGAVVHSDVCSMLFLYLFALNSKLLSVELPLCVTCVYSSDPSYVVFWEKDCTNLQSPR